MFHGYCTFGNPLNSTLLKSSLLLKMMRDCCLVAELTTLPKHLQPKATQVFTVEIDIIFKQVCKQVSNTKAAYSQVSNVVQDYTILESNRSR